jgi:FkbM family methyltransferase
MKSYSQNGEDIFVLEYFRGFKGTLLEIGANDGKTLSNSLLLIENGWKAHLVEPGEVYSELKQLHKDNDSVHTHFIGIGEKTEVVGFYKSGAHVIGGNDRGLVSTSIATETTRWRNNGVHFEECFIQMVSFNDFMLDVKHKGLPDTFDFISIDVEGLDWQVLQQIDLTLTSCLVIEWNGIEALKVQFTDYCTLYGLKLVHINNENLIFVK